MILSTWTFEYALQLQSTKMICFRYQRHPMRFLMFSAIPKIHFHQSGPFKLIKTMLKYLHVLLGLSPVWNRYPKGSHMKGEDILCKECVFSTIWSSKMIPIP